MYPYYPQQYPYNQMRQPTSSSLNGRIVTNIEEARASQIDLDGSQWYFPCPSDAKIYTKSINMNGLPVFNTYILTKSCPQNANNSDMMSRIENLEKIVKEMKKNGPSANDEPNAAQPSYATI